MAHRRSLNHGRARKILCIEDDRETAALIAEELIDCGFEVSTAYGGQEGLLAIMKATPDLVLYDISMPTMTGFEVLERLTEFAPRPKFHDLIAVLQQQMGDLPTGVLTTDQSFRLSGI
jgi:CheY-like chemotaxis protein